MRLWKEEAIFLPLINSFISSWAPLAVIFAKFADLCIQNLKKQIFFQLKIPVLFLKKL